MNKLLTTIIDNEAERLHKNESLSESEKAVFRNGAECLYRLLGWDGPLYELLAVRNKLYDELPAKGETKAWDVLKVIKGHLDHLDNIIDKMRNSPASPSPQPNFKPSKNK